MDPATSSAPQSQDIDWARLDPRTVVIATPQRAWVADTAPAYHQTSRASIATTRKLLDGAIALAQRQTPAGEPPPPLSPLRWLWRLAGYYQLTRATPRLMAEAADRFLATGEPELAAWAAEKAREEQGHDRLALRDIAALGYDAARVVIALVPEPAVALVGKFTAYVRRSDPLACVGYAHTLERLALEVRRPEIDAVQALLPAGVDATRCMRVHSGIGSDAAHVDDNVALIAALPPHRRAVVIAAVHETATLCMRPPPGGHVTDDAIARAIAVTSPHQLH
jgi:hypothetical protein